MITLKDRILSDKSVRGGDNFEHPEYHARSNPQIPQFLPFMYHLPNSFTTCLEVFLLEIRNFLT